jgi:hypothetical protein
MLLLTIGYVLWVIFGIFLSVQDLKHQKVSAMPLTGFLTSCFLIFYFERICCFLPLLAFAAIGIGYFLIKKEQAFGKADYIVIIANSFIISSDTWPVFLISCGTSGVLTSLFCRSKKFPMIPAILISALISRYCFLK